MAERKILLQKVTLIPRRKAGDLHFPRKLRPLCIPSFGANIEVPAEQAAASAIRISRPNPPIAQPELETSDHTLPTLQ